MDIKEYDFIKIGESVYLVRDYKNGDLDYYFKCALKSTGDLHRNGTKRWCIDGRIRRPTTNEISAVILKIKIQFPGFEIEKVIKHLDKDSMNLSEEICIQYLKNRGYIICKQF
jgi:hypothetical protein